MQLVVSDFSWFSVIWGTGEQMLLKIGKDLSFKIKVDFIMNSLILSAELFWSVFSWSILSKAILSQELSMSMAVHRATLHRRHCTQVLHFQAVLPIYVFSRCSKTAILFCLPSCFLGGRRWGRGRQSEQTLVIWGLLPTPGPSSTLEIRKMSLFSVQIIYT